ncbi:pyridoxamine 5'-phosphate oxidase family protein (plasmid) [Ensifer adhaerens]|uniref:pyridoxamine 5'-phosphate oxidase family protein n=1 Tax=Ensifer adhaerens TaxID=106592 RepID=UPI0023A956B3|nr:pyridoxamine 5'-phosphate oxidase family protein [Ensifer adhaerens]WDZ81917.1 pyridoxamine 5'-phosphate oxidase family protein [Ensifer adhaerens]
MSLTLSDISKELKSIDFGMLSTKSVDGVVRSRPMSNNGDVEYDGDSWFFCYWDSRKIADINADPQVGLTYTAPPSLLGKLGIFIAIEGNASLVKDREMFKKHWVSDLGSWFPQGVDTHGLVLIKVRASRISYWDGDDSGNITIP